MPPVRPMERISAQEQLERWVAGESIHRIDESLPTRDKNECCPDFSCCKPEFLAPKEIREAFAAADEVTRLKFLAGFLGDLITKEYPDKQIHITGPERNEQ